MRASSMTVGVLALVCGLGTSFAGSRPACATERSNTASRAQVLRQSFAPDVRTSRSLGDRLLGRTRVRTRTFATEHGTLRLPNGTAQRFARYQRAALHRAVAAIPDAQMNAEQPSRHGYVTVSSGQVPGLADAHLGTPALSARDQRRVIRAAGRMHDERLAGMSRREQSAMRSRDAARDLSLGQPVGVYGDNTFQFSFRMPRSTARPAAH